jgi:uncharacterized protein (TIGR03118 family)
MSMKTHHRIAVAFACALALAGCAVGPHDERSGLYQQRNLVADTAAAGAENVDPNLLNPWGVAFNPFGVVWVNDNHSGKSTLYDGDGRPQTLVVTIPGATAGAVGSPTGIVFYGGPGFIVRKGPAMAPARFIFASEDGGISGWAPTVDATNAIRVVNNPAAIYKGLALSAGGTGPLLYAADFRNKRVDVFDTNFAPVTLPGHPFRDPHLPHDYAPFGIQEINGDIYVTYGKQNADRTEEVTGAGNGFVSVFSPTGQFVRRFASQGVLNAPWGLSLAPASFGQFGNRLLVGNFGDGTINAFDVASGRFVGTLHGKNRKPIRIDGLWGIAFGNGLANQPTNTLFFAAGTNDEKNGLYGRLDAIPERHHYRGGDPSY